jgi:hypothetical protein
MKKYTFKSLAMMGDMYDENDEEANVSSGTAFHLVTDVENLVAQLDVVEQALREAQHAQSVGFEAIEAAKTLWMSE